MEELRKSTIEAIRLFDDCFGTEHLSKDEENEAYDNLDFGFEKWYEEDR